MNNLIFNILNNGKFVGTFSTSFEKYDINSYIFRIYNSENDSYQDIKITAELLKPKKIEKENEELKERINKAIEYIEQLEQNEWEKFGRTILLEILKGED